MTVIFALSPKKVTLCSLTSSFSNGISYAYLTSNERKHFRTAVIVPLFTIKYDKDIT